jgi:hypothetical protein
MEITARYSLEQRVNLVLIPPYDEAVASIDRIALGFDIWMSYHVM